MAIPKKIHYVWVGSAKLPPKDQQYIRKWQELNPNYEIRCWTERDVDQTKYPLLRKALREHRWALAADIIRIYAVYQEGGFYFDTDVELLKPLDEFLKYDGIANWESNYWFTTSAFAAQKHSPWLAKILKRYEITNPRHITNDTFMRTVHSPSVYANDLYHIKSDGQTHTYHQDKFITLAPEYFNPKHYITGQLHQTSKTVAIHHYASTWHGKFEHFMAKLGVATFRITPRPLYRFGEFYYHKIITAKIHREYR